MTHSSDISGLWCCEHEQQLKSIEALTIERCAKYISELFDAGVPAQEFARRLLALRNFNDPNR